MSANLQDHSQSTDIQRTGSQLGTYVRASALVQPVHQLQVIPRGAGTLGHMAYVHFELLSMEIE